MFVTFSSEVNFLRISFCWNEMCDLFTKFIKVEGFELKFIILENSNIKFNNVATFDTLSINQ